MLSPTVSLYVQHCAPFVLDVWCAKRRQGESRRGAGVQTYMVKLSMRILKSSMTHSDNRTKLESDMVTGIEAVKTAAWEGPFLERILRVRDTVRATTHPELQASCNIQGHHGLRRCDAADCGTWLMELAAGTREGRDVLLQTLCHNVQRRCTAQAQCMAH